MDHNTQLLLDQEAIRQTRYLFAQSLDDKNPTLMERLFTDEVDVDYSAFGIPAGVMTKAALMTLFQQPFGREGLLTAHLNSNFRITLNGDSATSRSNFIGHHSIKGFAGGDEFIVRGEYTDTLVRTPQGWLITGVRLKIVHMSGNVKLLG